MSNIEITIDPTWRLLSSVGDRLDLTTTIAQTGQDIKPKVHQVPLAKQLGFAPDRIFKYLKKNIGQKIEVGDIMAEKDGIFSSKKFVSEYSGVLVAVDHHTGEISIEENLQDESMGKQDIKSLVKGEVTKSDVGKITVKVEDKLEVELTKPLLTRLGTKVVLSDNKLAILLTQPDVENATIVVPDITDYIVSKLGALCARAIVTASSISSSDVVFVLSEKPVETISRIVEFGPKYVYAEPGATKLIFYK